MTVEEIRELIHLVSDSNIAELEVQRGENRVRIKRSGGEAQSFYYTGGQQPTFSTQPPQSIAPQPPVPAAGSGMQGSGAAGPKTPAEDPAVQLVKSPIVGTFYESASPGSPAFVRIGETVQAGRVLCIIESMKLMNEIEAEFAGVIESKLVPNGSAVEYGEALFAIRAI